MRSLLSSEDFARQVLTWETATMRAHDSRPRVIPREEWPLPNVWVGVSAENEKWASIRWHCPAGELLPPFASFPANRC